MLSNKHVFWEALIIAMVIFWTGIFLGVLFESSRANKIEELYFQAETDIFDIQLEGELLSMFESSCEQALKENIDYADRIYLEARKLGKYDAATRITEDIVRLHKRYDLLRVMLWKNMIQLQQKCPSKTNVIVYLYQYDNPSTNKQARQITFSKVLSDLKEKHGDSIVLIPIAYDTNVKSLNILKERYELNTTPMIIINQKQKITELQSVEDLEKIMFENSEDNKTQNTLFLN
ncbi:MAG: hypothetical protein KJ718_04810 [Nanoarchaeota archaeon]|nr:hypothetical protein [Nanoarchaeota archaeon]MBU1051848.1 hypothetical protein [Nanoarchaeota archaeon]MBU1988232.1 hypothetical protein [Nanoarchaeota archaeon]